MQSMEVLAGKEVVLMGGHIPYPSLQDRGLLKAEVRWEIEREYRKSIAKELCSECRRELKLEND